MSEDTYILKSLSNEAEYPLSKHDITVGRGKDCDIEIPDDALSRKHIIIHIEGQDIWVEDLGSTNGSTLNYAVLGRKTKIKHGDVLSLGGFELKLMDPNASPVTQLRQPQPNPASSYIDYEQAGDNTTLRQIFTLPGGWSQSDRTKFTSVHGTISEDSIFSLLSAIKKNHTIAALIILSPNNSNHAIALNKNKQNEWTIGRNLNNHLVLNSSTISGNHATITKSGNSWHIRDNNSRNGLSDNGKKEAQQLIKHNVLIELGEVFCIFRQL